MITFTEGQIISWLSAVIWPFLRVLALMTSAPLYSSRAVPMRVKIGLSMLVIGALGYASLNGSFALYAYMKINMYEQFANYTL